MALFRSDSSTAMAKPAAAFSGNPAEQHNIIGASTTVEGTLRSSGNVNISGTEFELFTEGEWAWPATPAEDAKLITAMKRGADAVVTARSSRGTTTKDTFSLLGFTAAVEDAEKRCSS